MTHLYAESVQYLDLKQTRTAVQLANEQVWTGEPLPLSGSPSGWAESQLSAVCKELLKHQPSVAPP